MGYVLAGMVAQDVGGMIRLLRMKKKGENAKDRRRKDSF